MSHSLEGSSISSSNAYQKKEGLSYEGIRGQREKLESSSSLLQEQRGESQPKGHHCCAKCKTSWKTTVTVATSQLSCFQQKSPISVWQRIFLCPNPAPLHSIMVSFVWALSCPRWFSQTFWVFLWQYFYNQLIFKLTDSEYNRALHHVCDLIQSEGLNQRARLPPTRGWGRVGFPGCQPIQWTVASFSLRAYWAHSIH